MQPYLALQPGLRTQMLLRYAALAAHAYVHVTNVMAAVCQSNTVLALN